MMYLHLSNLYKNLSIFKNLARKKIERYIFFPVLTFKNSTFKLLKLTSWKWSKLFWCNHRFISNSNLVKTIIESQSTTEHLLQIWSQPYSTTCVHSNRLHLKTHTACTFVHNLNNLLFLINCRDILTSSRNIVSSNLILR